VVEGFPSKCEALRSNLTAAKNKSKIKKLWYKRRKNRDPMNVDIALTWHRGFNNIFRCVVANSISNIKCLRAPGEMGTEALLWKEHEVKQPFKSAI
jgi:hypothetical protein